MRKLFLACSIVLFTAGTALAGGKISVKWNCGAADPAHTLGAGDQADHIFMIGQVNCTAASGEIAGVKSAKGTGTEFHELKGSDDTFKGVFVETLANGDSIHYTYEGTAKMTKEGALASATNTWKATAGTGKFKGIQASGTCTAKGAPGGGATFECKGDYELPK